MPLSTMEYIDPLVRYCYLTSASGATAPSVLLKSSSAMQKGIRLNLVKVPYKFVFGVREPKIRIHLEGHWVDQELWINKINIYLQTTASTLIASLSPMRATPRWASTVRRALNSRSLKTGLTSEVLLTQ